MSKFALALKSRTLWTVVVMLVFNLIPHLPVDQSVKDLVNGILTLLAAYFHVNPSQNYNAIVPNSTIIDGTPTGGSFGMK
jgi:hypothetical protein